MIERPERCVFCGLEGEAGYNGFHNHKEGPAHDCCLIFELGWRIRELKSLLQKYTDWRGPGVGILPHREPAHGPCCTCQECGHYHDECVCEHNEIERALGVWG